MKEGGRGPTVWDTFAHSFGKVIDLSNADVAVDRFHRFEEDIQLMKDMGMDAYRFSIAWSRLYPNGTGQVNQAGIDHYNRVINSLLAKGIEPYVTIYHWDLPQALEDKYTGWFDRQIMEVNRRRIDLNRKSELGYFDVLRFSFHLFAERISRFMQRHALKSLGTE